MIRPRSTAIAGLSPLYVAVFLLSLFAVFFTGSSNAEASHYRYGTMSWTPGSGNTINFTHQEAWRRTAFGCYSIASDEGTACSGLDGYSIIGDIAFAGSVANYGDNTSESYNGYVNSFDDVNDWVYWTLIDPASYPSVDTSISHTYPASGDYTWVNEGCCRISTNNSASSWRLEGLVNVGTGNRSPVSLLPPFVLCQEEAVCQFTIPAIDPDSDDLNFRFSTPAEDAGISQPVGATLDATTGVYTWDTNNGTQGYYATQIVVEDLNSSGDIKSMIPLSFLIQVVPFVPGVAPEFDETTGPVCGSTINGSAGSNINFDVRATDADIASGDTVTLNAIGLPSGASMTPSLPLIANPVTSNFSWTPGTSDIGGTVAFFTATDTTLRQAQCAININVSDEGPRYENTSDRVEYDGNCWTTVNNASASGGSAAASKTKNCKATFSFTGDRVDFISAKGPMLGKAKVYIDGVLHMGLDLYGSTLSGDQLVYFRTFEEVGEHEIMIQVAGSKNSKSSNTYVAVDAFEVYNEVVDN